MALAEEVERFIRRAKAESRPPLVAGIVPHAGLAFSGATAAKVYAWISRNNSDIETFLIFGAVHTSLLSRPAIWVRGAWQTPMENIPVDEELASALVKAGIGDDNERPHLDDNAIELQTPFIARVFPHVKIVPVATPPLPCAVEAGAAAWEVCRRLGRKVVALGSTDLTHYGHAFGLVPAGEGKSALEWSRENDRKLIYSIVALEAEKIVPVAKRDQSACGAGAVAAAVAFARAAGCVRGELLEHTNSYEIMPDGRASHFVGYGALAFSREESGA
jgi:AmmeMemoRadiSam system protein B